MEEDIQNYLQFVMFRGTPFSFTGNNLFTQAII